MKLDFHSHILPEIDDGSRSVEESIEMLKLEAAQGITHVIATPHFYASDAPERFLQRREQARQCLQEEMQNHPGLPRISVGAEVYYFRGISNADILPNLTIEDGSYLLLEMPVDTWTDTMFKEIGNIYLKHGITPVIAHIDRYISPFTARRTLERLSELPVLVQANANFFLRPSTRPMALRMLRRRQIHLLGSDCHDCSTRPPNLGPVYQLIQERLGLVAADFVDRCGERVLREILPDV